ncbi:MAG: TetR family transcriptional regulator [Acidimicrobiia bacterium]|nr:TetR family transcriptional regulator [Acidimicrobiia bacterium]MBT8193339.1 TetR family transcriptional regulator [Acidimicrobiia bacterium]MBT8247840.1 TetR family transcriptional regulator [Acidimicrobiia bacterium]NNF89394.1 TetR family transcriptional regulator [Acidimicrobiia bacterium]NNJ47480.1 TetR family transcriptional regulator [Acidimicrobiia bacterium]
MSSGAAPTSVDDRTAKARIRDAAIECFAEHGLAATTARKVAAAADVSPGLVIHHFGSMDGLRSACDEHVVATIRDYKTGAMAEGPGLDILAAFRDAPTESLMGYLAAVLHDDSPRVAKLVDDLVADAEAYLQLGVETGMVRPSSNPRARAAIVVLWSLGALALHHHVQRILGVDLTDPDIVANQSISAYAAPAYEVLTEGIISQEFAPQVSEAFRIHSSATKDSKEPT